MFSKFHLVGSVEGRVSFGSNGQFPQSITFPQNRLCSGFGGIGVMMLQVVFAGDAAVGKTSFINRITKGVFLSNLSSTLGKNAKYNKFKLNLTHFLNQMFKLQHSQCHKNLSNEIPKGKKS